MRIVHFSDPHAGGPAEDCLAYFDKRWVGVFNYRFRRQFRHDLTRLERAVSFILRERPDVAVCTGDLTSSGQPGEFEKVRPILQPLRDSGIPFFYLPGNHDCYVTRPKCVRAVHEMVEYLSGGNYRFADLPTVRRCGNVEFLLLNTSRPSNLLCSWGFVDPADAEYLAEHCRTPKTGPRILLNHYPILEPRSLLRLRHQLFRQEKVAALIRSGAIDLSLCGHVHRPYSMTDEQGRGEICAGSVTRNGSMLLLDVADDGSSTVQTIQLDP